ncbi:translation initiation factor IF3-1, mitochondrial [Vigna unguiculata]|uniref:translation initiation factor IF3-1, mitochondrial n=1 Tax=Vigna unguiculata TaxID=3917 RepID=UPI001016676E|nr:translation initiation factor IF3-1, mitochondrial [Vigna unguiculata]
MALWHRIGKAKLRTLCIQFQRSYIHLHHASAPKPCHMDIPRPNSVFHARPTSVFSTVRFFAAPVQFQVKNRNEEEDPSERRMNEKIKAPYVRLVVDDGHHSIVPRLEALERAKALKLDLVEVDKSAHPPVCKIMDYHKEMYKRHEWEKDRAKSKADTTIRKDVKEVRFSEKIEAKDLKNKADMVRKLMEKGYRVKCKVSSSKENLDLTALFSPFIALLEDVCVVESGPFMAKKDAYMIVRHIKFGAAKKSGKKFHNAANTVTQEGNAETSTANPSDSVEYESHAESRFETEEDPSDAAESPFLSRSNDPVSPPVSENRYRRTNPQGENNVQSKAQVPPAETENRYKRVEPRNRFQQTSNNPGMNNYQGPGTRDTFRPPPPPPNWNRPRQAPGNVNVDTRIENNRQAFTPPGSRHSMPSRENIHNHPSNASNTPRPGYGNFRGPNGGYANHAGAPNTSRPSYGNFSASNDGIPKHPNAPNSPKTF